MPKNDKSPINSTLEAFLRLVQDLPTRKEFAESFGNVVTRVKTFETSLTRDFGSLVSTVNKKIDDKLAAVKDGKDGAPGKDGKNGENIKGDKGDKGDPGESIVGPAGKDGSPDDAFDTRNKLELLEGDERLKATAISGLEDAIQKHAPTAGGTTGWGAHPLQIKQAGTVKNKVARVLNFKGTGAPTITQNADGTTDLDFASGGGAGITLTTTGTSGAATLVGTVLNVPQYAGGGTGITRSVNVISTNTAAGATASTDYVYYISGASTLTLPTAAGNTNMYRVIRTGTSTVGIATTSSQTINAAAAPLNLITQYTSVDLGSDGANWFIH